MSHMPKPAQKEHTDSLESDVSILKYEIKQKGNSITFLLSMLFTGNFDKNVVHDNCGYEVILKRII